MKINVGNVTFQAHSGILAAQSLYFAKALQDERAGQNGRAIVALFEEGKHREFSFKEGSIQAYARLFRYVYLRSYSISRTWGWTRQVSNRWLGLFLRS